MDYDHLAVGLGNQITEMLSREMDFSVWQKSLTEIVNNSMLDMKAIISENMQQSTRAFEDAFLRIDPVDITSAAAACLNSATEQLNSSVYQNMASQLADTLLKSMQSVPLDDFAARPEIPVEEVQAALSDVRSCLPEEAVEILDTKVEEAKAKNDKISRSDWIAIVGILVTIFIFVVGQLSSAAHDRKEEEAWSATAEYQQQDLALKQEALECLKNLQESPLGIGQSSESISDQCQGVDDLIDSQNDA